MASAWAKSCALASSPFRLQHVDEGEVDVQVVVQPGALLVRLLQVAVVPPDRDVIVDHRPVVAELGGAAEGDADGLARPAAADPVLQLRAGEPERAGLRVGGSGQCHQRRTDDQRPLRDASHASRSACSAECDGCAVAAGGVECVVAAADARGMRDAARPARPRRGVWLRPRGAAISRARSDKSN